MTFGHEGGYALNPDQRGGHTDPAEAAAAAEARRRLVDAAPDLLAACLAAIHYDLSIAGQAARGDFDLTAGPIAFTTGDDLDAMYEDWVGKARAAVEKATGVRPPDPCP